jgi:hypothetical protein
MEARTLAHATSSWRQKRTDHILKPSAGITVKPKGSGAAEENRNSLTSSGTMLRGGETFVLGASGKKGGNDAASDATDETKADMLGFQAGLKFDRL